MNDSTYSVQEIKAHQHLPGDLFNNVDGETLAIEFFENLP